MENRVGIWMDKREAFLFSFDNSSERKHIRSSIHEFNPKGGSRSKTAFGPVETVKEKKYLAKVKKQELEYFKDVLDALGNAKSLIVIGPAQTKNKFAKYLEDENVNQPELLKVETADSMTENQMRDTLRRLFVNLNN
ncbi:MAG: hypothetical protein HKN09_13995 [Saprospiraceae bacterium]|nr:hypothetical protein [Saprospiraceae bacterium]